ncbi:MAG: bacterial Ig-like domain-containing protein [Clostridiales bacterium]|nr:bacterial Ig-like domain-containing protein [Clostridiales bacterium]
MKNLLNAVNFFGHELDWNQQLTIVWMIVIQVVLIVMALSLIIYIILRRRLRNQATESVVYTVAQPTTQTTEVKRELTGIWLDLAIVQRKFAAGDAFTCEGMVVNGEYNATPTSESILEYSLTDNDTYMRLAKRDKNHGTVYVIKPYMYTAGIKVVTVHYENMTASYTISVEERMTKVVEEPAPVVEEKPEPVVQVAEPTTIVIEKPVEEKTRELMYIWINTDDVKKEYFVGESIDHDGLVVTAHFNVEPLEEEVSDYSVLSPDMSKEGKPTVTVTYQGKTVGYRITINPAPEVEAEPEPVVEEEPVVEPEVVAEEEPATVEEQPVVVEQQPTVIVQHADPIIVEEESISSRLRYDKSFTARLIQSDDEVKYWYTDLKNELFSFKSVHGRMSWKRETFKCHKDVVAKFAYRGKQLCIFLPLNPYDYTDSNYPVENASDMSCYEDTPLMIRLKSRRRVKFAKQLIATVMEQKGIVRIPHETVDYYIPYEGILELINRGLIKREIKLPEDEAIFEQNKMVKENQEDDSFQLTEVAPGIYVTKRD